MASKDSGEENLRFLRFEEICAVHLTISNGRSGVISEFIGQLVKGLGGRRMKVKDLRHGGLELRHIAGIWE